jgi:hypothetical protein
MFGHQNNTDINGQDNGVQHGSDAPASGSVGNLEPETIAPTASSPAVDDTSISSYVVTDLPDTSAVSENSSPEPASVPASPPVIPHPADPSGVPQPTPPPIISTAGSTTAAAPEAGDLLTLKQSALHELSPLLGHLEQTPEEKFRTTMMMIQASDDHTMLQSAYDAARSIKDEKARAQALLDVVNEINYFTQSTAETAS